MVTDYSIQIQLSILIKLHFFYIFTMFFQGGVRASGAPPLDPPLKTASYWNR